MYTTHFTISDFCITADAVPQMIADNILLHHIIPLNIVQDKLPFKIFVSYSVKGEPSGFRPYWYERGKGRSGQSQHTFGQRKRTVLPFEKGAIDLTCEDFSQNKDALLDVLIDHSPYIRIAEYNTFFHLDYKDLQEGKRRLFKSDRASNWQFIKYIP